MSRFKRKSSSDIAIEIASWIIDFIIFYWVVKYWN